MNLLLFASAENAVSELVPSRFYWPT